MPQKTIYVKKEDLPLFAKLQNHCNNKNSLSDVLATLIADFLLSEESEINEHEDEYLKYLSNRELLIKIQLYTTELQNRL